MTFPKNNKGFIFVAMKPLSFLLLIAIAMPCMGQVAGNVWQQKAQQHFETALEFIEQDSLYPALEALNRCLALDARYVQAYRERALVRKQLGDLSGAHTDLGILLETNPNQPEALLHRGLIRYDLGLFQLALDDLTRLSHLMDTSTMETSQIYFEIDPTGKARGVFTTEGSIRHLIHNYTGLILYKLGDYQTSRAHFDSAISLSPARADFYVNRARTHEATGNKQHALADYRRALAIDPGQAEALQNLGRLAAGEGDTARTELLLTEAIASNPDRADAYAERGYYRLQQNDLSGALNDYNHAVEASPSEPSGWLNRGIVKYKLGDWRGAYADFSRAIKLDEAEPRAWLSRGNVLIQLNRPKEAIDDYTIAISLDHTYARAFFNRAVAYHSLGMNEKACADISTARTLGMEATVTMIESLCN